MQVTFLGTGTSSGVPVIGCRCAVCRSSDPRNQRYRSSILVQWEGRNVVVDTGPEFRLQALRAGLDRLDAILVTHEHADHIFGLDDVRFFGLRGDGPLPLYAEERTLQTIRAAFPYIFHGQPIPGSLRPSLDLHDITGPFDLFGKNVTPVRVYHGRLPITAFRIGDFAYVTDCSLLPPESEDALQGLDTLVLGALRHRPHPTHYSLSEAVETAERLAPRRTFLTHIGHDLDHETTNAALPSSIRLAYDTLQIESD
jgi:phosphoribosyl 1,2-cyclic phosphate phosphodiesterase